MAWSTPPTFADGEILSATKLNQLSDGVTYLNGLQSAPAAMNLCQTVTSTTDFEFWCFRHRHRYLQVRYWSNGSGSGDEISIWYNGAKIFYDNAPDIGENWLKHLGTTVMDLNTVAGFVAYGQPYSLTVRVVPSSGGKLMTLRLVAEMNVMNP